MPVPVVELTELVVERPDHLLGGADHGPVDRVALVDRGDRRDAVHPGLDRGAQIGIAAARPVDVRDMDLDVGDPSFEPGEALADLLLEPAVALAVAVNLVVGVDLNEQDTLHCWHGVECPGEEGVPDKIPPLYLQGRGTPRSAVEELSDPEEPLHQASPGPPPREIAGRTYVPLPFRLLPRYPRRHGQTQEALRLPGLRLGPEPLDGPMPRLHRVEHAGRGCRSGGDALLGAPQSARRRPGDRAGRAGPRRRPARAHVDGDP